MRLDHLVTTDTWHLYSSLPVLKIYVTHLLFGLCDWYIMGPWVNWDVTVFSSCLFYELFIFIGGCSAQALPMDEFWFWWLFWTKLNPWNCSAISGDIISIQKFPNPKQLQYFTESMGPTSWCIGSSSRDQVLWLNLLSWSICQCWWKSLWSMGCSRLDVQIYLSILCWSTSNLSPFSVILKQMS